jgi:hypothetical protein
MLGRFSTTVISALGVVVWHAQYHGASAQTCDTYVVSSMAGGFTQKAFIDFSGVSPGSAASLLS